MPVMPMLRALCRSAWLVLHIAVALPIVLACFRRPHPASSLQRHLFRWWLTGVCRIMRVGVSLRGEPQAGCFVVANHVSWLDIPALASVWPGAFLAKAEVGAWPVIGWLVRRAGTMLIRRGSIVSSNEAVASLQQQLNLGGGVCVFPEGTTTDGSSLRRFQPRLFEAAVRAGACIQPVALRYVDAGGNLHPGAPFIGDDDFASHLWRLLRGPALRAELVFLPPIMTQGHSARSLAALAQSQVSESLARSSGHATPDAAIDDEVLAESRSAA